MQRDLPGQFEQASVDFACDEVAAEVRQRQISVGHPPQHPPGWAATTPRGGLLARPASFAFVASATPAAAVGYRGYAVWGVKEPNEHHREQG